MFSALCAPGALADIAVHHGHVNFNFDQANHPAFMLLGAGGGGGAPPDCCLALTISWIHNWASLPLRGYAAWVNPPGAGGHLNVLAHTVAIFAPPGPWTVATAGIMVGLGFAAAFGGLNAGPVWALRQAGIRLVVMAAPYTILIASGGGASHAVGVKRVGQAIFFFDPNHGEVYFASADDFAAWFVGGYSAACIVPAFGAAPLLHSFRYI